MVDNVIENLQTDIQKLEQEVEFLNKQDKIINLLRTEVKSLTGELSNFSQKYLPTVDSA